MIAEGIEDQATLDMLYQGDVGDGLRTIRGGQGYYLGRANAAFTTPGEFTVAALLRRTAGIPVPLRLIS